jgi:hypothetical protein
MMRGQLPRIVRLEKAVRLYLRSQDEWHAQFASRIVADARIKLIIVALFVLYGEPKITESLEVTWQRCRQSSEWKACLERHPDFGPYGRDDNATPFIDYSARHIANYFEKYFLPDLPGDSEKEKLQRILECAPGWLLYFTCADICARWFGIPIPRRF